jgi:type I restriction enzyme R subunit
LIYKEGYPPEWDQEVFEKVLVQVESYKQGQAPKQNMSTLKLENVEDDKDVRNLIFNRLQMDYETSDLDLQREVIEVYGERYGGMSVNDWRHIIEAYTPMVREAARPKAKEVSMQAERLDMAAEPPVEEDEE